MDLGFALNYQFVYLIDTNPTGAEDWAFLGPGVESFTNDRADTTVDKAYWDKGGATSTNVTAVTSGWTVAGDRLIGDKAQDYIVGLTYLKGAERKTRVRQVGPDGEAVEWPCTIVEIKGAGADGNTPDNVPFGCSIKCEGDPVLVAQAAGAELPESVTVEDVEVGVGPRGGPLRRIGLLPVRRGRIRPRGVPRGRRGQRARPGGRRDGGHREVLRQAHRQRHGARDGYRRRIGDTHGNMSREAGEEAQPPRPFLLLRERNGRNPWNSS